jgi:hypothetical protein
MAAGALLIREAGGLVADLDGSENYLDSGNIVCGNPKCFKAVLQALRAAPRGLPRQRTPLPSEALRASGRPAPPLP